MEESDHKIGLNNVDSFHLLNEFFRKIMEDFFELKVIRKRIMNESDGKLIFQLRYFFFQCPYHVVKNLGFLFFFVLGSIETVHNVTFNIIWWFCEHLGLANSFLLPIVSKLIYLFKFMLIILQCLLELFGELFLTFRLHPIIYYTLEHPNS